MAKKIRQDEEREFNETYKSAEAEYLKKFDNPQNEPIDEETGVEEVEHEPTIEVEEQSAPVPVVDINDGDESITVYEDNDSIDSCIYINGKPIEIGGGVIVNEK